MNECSLRDHSKPGTNFHVLSGLSGAGSCALSRNQLRLTMSDDDPNQKYLVLYMSSGEGHISMTKSDGSHIEEGTLVRFMHFSLATRDVCRRPLTLHGATCWCLLPRDGKR